MKDSASAQNTIVAFYREYSRYHYLYFTIENKGISIRQHTSIARARGKGNDRN